MFDPTVLSALEFDGVLSLLQAHAATPMGVARVAGLLPSPDAVVVRRENERTREAVRHLDTRGLLPLGTVPDVTPHLARLAVEGTVLAPGEVLDLLTLLRTGRAVKSFLGEGRAAFPGLWDEAASIPDLGNLMRFLDGKISVAGQIEDHASDELRAVRQELQRSSERLQRVLEAIVTRPEAARALMDDFVSLRSERHVIPVRAEARSLLPGIVHGISGTGATVYVEPLETVDLNNEIVTLRDREQAEVRRLLQEYSELLRGRLAELRTLVLAIGRLDLLMAKARLARALRASPAAESAVGAILLRGARHPLLEANLGQHGGRVVPLDLAIPAGTRVLVLSGPNTGGKTVALKTVGLLSLMFQSGLMVPADEAALPIFRGIFIDIGDRQSIPDGLSTFSARMKTAAAIVAGLEPPALTLLDEVGTGTDPEEGVALALAIVDHLRARGATLVVTTHLEPIKAYAATTGECANAAMEFDAKTGAPTYRLVPGIPGRSGALEIAARLGLPAPILEDARRRRGRSVEMIGEYLERLRRLSEDLETRVAEVAAERARLERERSEREAALREREERQRRAVADEIDLALRSVREEGRRYLESLREREVRVRLQRQESRAAEALRAEARRQIGRVTGGTAAPEPETRVAPGSRVRVAALGAVGTVERVTGDRAVVLVRGKRLAVPLSDCRPETGGDRAGPPLPGGVTLARRPAGSSRDELQLRGQTVEDAVALLDKYLDDAYLEGLSPVRLVHGVGSGRLKRAVADLLTRHPHVRDFAPAAPDEGGQGVTVVNLRL